MSIRSSARREADLAEARAAEYRRRADAEQQRAAKFRVADRTETEVASRLRAMEPWGWRLLVDRRWSQRSRANIDMLLIGPGGVLVVDVKCWAEPDIVDGRLYRGQADAMDEVDKLNTIAELVADATSEVGLAPIEITPVMVFLGQRDTNTSVGRVRIVDERTIVPWATARGARLADDQIKLLTALLDARFPEPKDEPQQPVSAVITEPVLAGGRHHEPSPDTMFDATALSEAIIARELAKPIEDWMTFLHPEQARLVRRTTVGPSRIGGAAGTGKTVVALHRAAYLAEALPGPVLMTTFIKTLPPVLRSLHARLSPATVDKVEFVNLHAWASQLLAERGHRQRPDRYRCENAFARAWSRHGKGSVLGEVGVPWTYWRDEIDYVIKGRGITDFDSYAALRRVGRRTALQPAHREIVWNIYTDYETQLRDQGVIDFNDLISLALAEIRERPLDVPYSAVIADEVQDLSCQAARLLAEISDAGRTLLVVGDGQQQIYPGGYTLNEAGISVTGRSTILRTNYRNAAAIIQTAAHVVAADEFQDLDDSTERGGRDFGPTRDGGQVWTADATSADDLRRLAVEHVRTLVSNGHRAGDTALLCETNDEAATYVALLKQAGIDAMKLANYVGKTTDAVKVGTVNRAKGLEFKHVVHPIRRQVRPDRNTSPEALLEETERANRELFVAMTRARDTLWVGRVKATTSETPKRPSTSRPTASTAA